MSGSQPNLLVIGLGVSGAAVARYAARRPNRFASVTVVDAADNERLRAVARQLESEGVRVELGSELVEGCFDTCVASPGIAPHTELARAARAVCTRVISELEFAFTESRCPWVAVTGTNGKTTTTALVTHLLNCGGLPARSVGNIGTPAIEGVEEGDENEILIAEVSSFQLALTETFHPRVAVLLNITPDHLDWHGSFDAYAADKRRIFANLGPDDVAVVDADDPGAASVLPLAEEGGPRVVTVAREHQAGGAGLRDGMLVVPDHSGNPVELLSASALRIKGAHNLSNALAAAVTAHELGVPPADLVRGLESFIPIEHRLEPVATVSGAEWFNDSKATNPDAVSKALGAFDGRPVVLLLGGRNKGNDFGPLAAQAAERTRVVIAFGECREEIARAFEETGLRVVVVSTMAEAVSRAVAVSQPGDAVVLSPACASFDEFTGYEERGRVFKSLVAALADEDDA